MDSAIKQAYAMLSSWRRYLKWRAGRVKPRLRRKFMRIREMLYHDGVIKISVKPYEESIDLRGHGSGIE